MTSKDERIEDLAERLADAERAIGALLGILDTVTRAAGLPGFEGGDEIEEWARRVDAADHRGENDCPLEGEHS